MIVALVALTLTLAAPTRFPGILVQSGFMTPSGNIACNVGLLGPGTHGPRAIGCSVYSKTNARYALSTWWMRTTGPVRFAWVLANPATDYPTLAYGRSYAWHGVRCTSASTSLTCRNLSGHGFFLSRRQQRTF